MNSSKLQKKWLWSATATLALGVVLAGCGQQSGSEGTDTPPTGPGTPPVAPTSTGDANLTGKVTADGSSTVGPITSAIADPSLFKAAFPKVDVAVGISGTGGGFKKFATGSLDISDASRPIKDKEAAAAKAKGVDYIELPIAYDGISVVVNKKNTWAKDLTTDELKKIWITGSKINNWSQVRKGFPNKALKLYGPDTASGTFDYFNEEILGKEVKPRSDYQPNTDDNALVEGVSKDEGALGYFGFAYYEENQAKLNLVGINSGKGAVLPSAATILDASYKPLSRPLFIYINSKSADRPEVKAFVDYYLANVKDVSAKVGYVPLQDDLYATAKARWEAKTTGTMFPDKASHSKTLEEIYNGKK